CAISVLLFENFCGGILFSFAGVYLPRGPVIKMVILSFKCGIPLEVALEVFETGTAVASLPRCSCI
ncbi:unnamed protein product, partial [Larinioides sclopetarius]